MSKAKEKPVISVVEETKELDNLLASLTLEAKPGLSLRLSREQSDRLDIFIQGQEAHDSSTEPLTSWNNIPVTLRDIRSLLAGEWLNDEILNAYGAMLKSKHPRFHVFSTFFYSTLCQRGYDYTRVRRWTRKTHLTQFHRVFVPINVSNSHWVAAYIDFERKEIVGLDSLMSSDRMLPILNNLKRYLNDENEDKSYQLDTSKFQVRCATSPQQSDGSSCGVFVCGFMYHIAMSYPLNFAQTDMNAFRKTLAYTLLRLQDQASKLDSK